MDIKNQTETFHKAQHNFLQALSLQPQENILSVLESLPIGCVLLDANFHFKYWNPMAEHIFGYRFDEVVGKHFSELVPPHGADAPFHQIIQEAGEKIVQAYEFDCIAKDGMSRTCRWNFTLLNFEAPSLLAVVQDISGEKYTEESIRRQVERIQALRMIDTAITGSMDFQVTLNIILQQAMTQLKMDATVVRVYDPSMKVLKFAVGRGLHTEALQLTSLRIGEGYAGMAALQKRVVRVPDLQQDQPNFSKSPIFAKEDFKSYYCVPLIAKGEIKGVMESFHRTIFKPDTEWLDFFETLGGQAAIAIDNSMLFNDLQRSNLELMLAYDTTLEGWSKALDMRDRDTEGHTRRVTEMTERLAIVFDIKDSERVHIRRGAILHDIGKMGIPDNILLKESDLSAEEWEIMCRHPALAMDMLSSISYLRPALDIPYCHHEKWNGTGYPRGLKGEQIPLAARIFAVADVFDALTSDRPYRRAWSTQQALDHIQSEAGNHFDPKVVDAFVKVVGKPVGSLNWR